MWLEADIKVGHIPEKQGRQQWWITEEEMRGIFKNSQEKPAPCFLCGCTFRLSGKEIRLEVKSMDIKTPRIMALHKLPFLRPCPSARKAQHFFMPSVQAPVLGPKIHQIINAVSTWVKDRSTCRWCKTACWATRDEIVSTYALNLGPPHSYTTESLKKIKDYQWWANAMRKLFTIQDDRIRVGRCPKGGHYFSFGPLNNQEEGDGDDDDDEGGTAAAGKGKRGGEGEDDGHASWYASLGDAAAAEDDEEDDDEEDDNEEDDNEEEEEEDVSFITAAAQGTPHRRIKGDAAVTPYGQRHGWSNKQRRKNVTLSRKRQNHNPRKRQKRNAGLSSSLLPPAD